MLLSNFSYINRQGSDVNVITSFLLNGRIVGPPGKNRIVKLPGYANSVTSREIQGGGNVVFSQAYRFKHPEHEYASENPTHFMYDPGKSTGTLYYWNETESKWIEITNYGSVVFLDSKTSQLRYWKNRGVLHINGFKGRPFVYLYIDRQAINNEGYFRDSLEYNGFYLVDEELPQFDLSDVAVEDVYIQKLQTIIHLNDTLDEDKPHAMMGVYVCDGQTSIYKEDSYIHSVPLNDAQRAKIVEIVVDSSTLDKRVTDIDFYVAHSKIEQVIPGELSKVDDQDQYLMDWRFFKRVSINDDVVWFESKGYDGEAQSQNQIDIDISESPNFDFGDNTFSNKLYLACKSINDSDWLVFPINDTVHRTPDATHCRFNLSSGALATGTLYKCRLLSRWADLGSGDWGITLLLYSDEQFGDPYDAIQPYSIYGEHYPYANFTTIQDRRAFRLDMFWDGKRKRNWLTWSEPDRTEVNPLQNKIELNTYSGENAMGLVSIANGLLALFERTIHYIRMTSEPIRYDGEENRFADSCISSNGVIDNGNLAFWTGIDGIKTFDGSRVRNIIGEMMKDDYMQLIASEYENNGNSYEGIVGAYCSKHKLLVWTFPHSTYQIEGEIIKLIAFDLDNPGVLFLGSDKNYTWLFEDYDGTLFGMDASGIYELFSDDPIEQNKLIWITGSFLQDNIAERVLDKFRFRYNGIMNLKVYIDDLTVASSDEALPTKTSLGNYTHRLALQAELFKLRMDSGLSIAPAEIDEVAIEGISRPK
jgi:hypothetical protein